MKNDRGYTSTELMIVVTIISIVFLIFPLVGLWTDRNLDFWLTHFKGHVVNVPYWISLVISIVLNAVVVGANIIAEICRYMI